MARIIFSALLSAASGKIGDVVLSKWKGIAYARRRVIPANPQTGKQCLQRHVLKVALLLWQSIKAVANDAWDLSASGYALSGYNMFMDDCMTALIPQFTAGGIGEDPTWTTPAITAGFPYLASYPELLDVDAGTPGAGDCDFTWTARAGAAANNMVNGYYRLDDATAWAAITPVLESSETITFDTGLDNEQYEFMLVGNDTTAEVFSESTHRLATPTA